MRADKICRSLVAAGARVILLARRGDNQSPQECYNGYEIYRVGLEGWPRWTNLPIPWNPLWYFKLRKITKKIKPHIFIAREIMLVELASWVSTEFKIPIYIDMAEHYPEAMRSWKKYSKSFWTKILVHKWKLPDWVEKRAVKRVTGIFTVCDENSDRLNQHYQVPAEKIHVVGNTPETHVIQDALIKMSFRKSPGKVFGYHGIVVGDRDLETVVKGFEIAAEIDPLIELVIAGGGESLESIETMVRMSRMRDRIQLQGPYKPEKLSELLDSFDYGIAPWKVNAFTQVTVANKFFEYALYGKPFIYASTRPMNRLIQDFQCGISYENSNPQSVASSMLKLMARDKSVMISSGRQAILDKYNWPIDFAKIVNLFSSL